MKKLAKKYLFLALLSGLFLAGCNKELIETPTVEKVKSMDDLKVSSNFNWELSQEVTLNIGMNFPDVIYQYNSVTVYDGDPAKDASVIFNGFGGNVLSRRLLQLKVYFPFSRIQEMLTGAYDHRYGILIMFRLGDDVGGSKCGHCAVIGKNQHLTRSGKHIQTDHPE